jgi:hypothetical protein
MRICAVRQVIHIRRGDIVVKAKAGKADDLWIPDHTYRQLLDTWLRQYPSHKIGIYSEGLPWDFESIVQGYESRVALVLNGDIERAFHHMVTAPHLFVAPSSFSVAPALINPNRVYYFDRTPHIDDYRVDYLPESVMKIPVCRLGRILWKFWATAPKGWDANLVGE